MQATRVIRRIKDTQLQELTSYIGQQVEIIIWPVTEDTSISTDDDLERKLGKGFREREHEYPHNIAYVHT